MLTFDIALFVSCSLSSLSFFSFLEEPWILQTLWEKIWDKNTKVYIDLNKIWKIGERESGTTRKLHGFYCSWGQEACSSSSAFCPAEWNESRQPEVVSGTNTHPTPLTLQAVLVFQPLWVLKWLIWYWPQWIVQDAQKSITKAIKNPEIHHFISSKKITLIFTICVLNKFNKSTKKKEWINGGLEAAFLIITTHYPSSKTIECWRFLAGNRPKFSNPGNVVSSNGRCSIAMWVYWNLFVFSPCFWRD